jgi:hypothetical protein
MCRIYASGNKTERPGWTKNHALFSLCQSHETVLFSQLIIWQTAWRGRRKGSQQKRYLPRLYVCSIIEEKDESKIWKRVEATERWRTLVNIVKLKTNIEENMLFSSENIVERWKIFFEILTCVLIGDFKRQFIISTSSCRRGRKENIWLNKETGEYGDEWCYLISCSNFHGLPGNLSAIGTFSNCWGKWWGGG